MAQDLDLDALKARLLARREALRGHESVREDAGETVELDQQRTGRLSRMDALQQQAMAKAGQQRVRAELQRIEAALQRLDGGDYGCCAACGEEIARGRLEADPSTPLCVNCAGGGR